MRSLPIAATLAALALAGCGYGSGNLDTSAAILNGEVAGVYTIAIPSSPTAGVHYVYVGSYGISYTAASGATQATVGDGLAAAFNEDANARARARATHSGGTLTITARQRGADLVVSYVFPSGSGTATTATAASVGSFVPAGRLVFSRRSSSSATAPTLGAGGVEVVAAPAVGLSGIQVVTATINTGTGAFFAGRVILPDMAVKFGPVAHNTNAATTATDIATAINTAMDAATTAGASVVAAATSGGAFTVTAEVAGMAFAFELTGYGSASATVAIVETTGPSYATDAAAGLFGVAAYHPSLSTDGQGGTVAGYKAASGLDIITRGEVAVSVSGETPAPGGVVFVGTDGRCYTTRAASRFALPKSRAIWGRSVDATTATIILRG